MRVRPSGLLPGLLLLLFFLIIIIIIFARNLTTLLRYVQTQSNIYEVVVEMNIRQLNVERRTDQIEDDLRRLQVKILIILRLFF